jgi:hypothetical protein
MRAKHRRTDDSTDKRENECTHEFDTVGFGVLTAVDITPCVIKCL